MAQQLLAFSKQLLGQGSNCWYFSAIAGFF
jgi:hypothetical protein